MSHLPSFTLDQARWFRLRRSGLVDPFRQVETAASALVGIQTQIHSAGGLALQSRVGAAAGSELTEAAFDRLLHQDRTLVKLWGQRGTLHTYAASDWPLIHGAMAAQRTWWQRRAAEQDTVAEFERVVDGIAERLRREGMLRRSDLEPADLDGQVELLSSWGGVFYELARRGEACHAGKENGEGLFAHRETWLPSLDWAPPGQEEANAEVARRYFASYGPATVQDFAYWRGCYAEAARRWVGRIESALTPVVVDGTEALVLAEDVPALGAAPPERGAWPVRLLYRFDPLLLAHKQKDWLIDPRFYKRVWRPAGHIEGTLLVDGRVIGTWNYKRRAAHLDVDVRPFGTVPWHARRAVKNQHAILASFFGLEPGRLTIGRR